MELRDYQVNAIADLRSSYGGGHRNVLFVLPTGGGKTVIFSQIARSAAAKGNRVCVLVHRAELLEQSCRALGAMGVEHGRIRGRGMDLEPMVIVASVQTLVRRLDKVPPETFSLIVVDEAHHTSAGSWAKVLDHFKGAKVLGVTATPCRLDGRGLKRYFEHMVLGPTPAALTDMGFLAKSKVFTPPIHGFNRHGLRSLMGDFDLEEAASVLKTREAVGDCVTHYRKHLRGGTAIAFCCTVDHAEVIAYQFNRAGIPAESIDGSMGDDVRQGKLQRLERGEIKVLTSCMLIGEGVDVPSVNGCILLRPTKSLSLFLQMVGRCLRPSGDKVAVILDHVGNYEKHGHHLMEREWSLEEGIKRKSEVSLSLWECPVCQCCNPSTSRECAHCGYEKPAPEIKELETVDGDLLELRWDAKREARWKAKQRTQEQAACKTYEELIALGESRGYQYPRAWATKVMASRTHRHVRRHATPIHSVRPVHRDIDAQAKHLASFFGGEVVHLDIAP